MHIHADQFNLEHLIKYNEVLGEITIRAGTTIMVFYPMEVQKVIDDLSACLKEHKELKGELYT